MRTRAFAFAVLVARAAPGQQHDSSTAIASAAALYKMGNEALKRGDDATACAKFEAGLKLYRSGSLLVRVADCEVRGGKLADASAHYSEAIEGLGKADPKDPQIAGAKERLRKIEKRIPRLIVRLATAAPSGTTVRCDGLDLPVGSLGEALPVNVGEHTIVVGAPGRREATFTASTAEGQTGQLDVSPGEPIGPSNPAGRRAADRPERAEPGATTKTLGFVFGGVGVVGVAVAAATGIVLKGKEGTVKDNCDLDKRVCNGTDAKGGKDAASFGSTMQYVFYGSAIVGVIGLGVGAYLVLSDEDRPVSVRLGPQGAMISGKF